MFRLHNTIRDYAWGSTTALAGLTGRTPTGRPEAEMWIGAHPGAPSRVEPLAGRPPGPAEASYDGATALDAADREGLPGLDELLSASPELLGEDTARRFGGLPFLAKLLAAAAPLSLQVHPSRERARAGFAAEERAGVPRSAPHRNYKDEYHKPELLFALTPFRALCGFREPSASARLFEVLAGSPAVGEEAAEAARALAGRLHDGDIAGAFTALLGGERREVTAAVAALVREAPAAVADLTRDGADPDPGLVELESIARHYPGDPGTLISLLLNHVTLEPGEAIALPAGNVHAYLDGLGVEVMASSDNVLRGGLTPKHVDVAELLSTVDFRPLPVPYVRPEQTSGVSGPAPRSAVYRPGFEEFQLQHLHWPAGAAGPGTPAPLAVEANGPVVVVATAGAVRLESSAGSLVLRPGEAAFVPAGEAPLTTRPEDSAGDADAGRDGGATAFAVTVPPRAPLP
ncbi:mannose-6-phosphate isomerase, class I [Zhihengliuella sp.]|uniref:mannose-6-phosphate isomerase, class I n=1 Tax=Zhihengliuella sp. TaxID=1954483 RepID=UPI0028127F69|nr:mannose-6-phosphate isomerase, class I [Zhihengliuella sp.]